MVSTKDTKDLFLVECISSSLSSENSPMGCLATETKTQVSHKRHHQPR